MQESKGTILVSVTDKTGLEKFLDVQRAGWLFMSTGGTMKALRDAGIRCVAVEAATGFPEMMDGRLKTLHPVIHGGILADRSKPDHLEMAKKHSITLIDIVVVNLYDFSGKPSIENIDVGGPTMIRGAAKNGASVAVVVEPSDYDELIEQLLETGTTSMQFRKYLAHKAFRHTATYDIAIANWMQPRVEGGDGYFE